MDEWCFMKESVNVPPAMQCGDDRDGKMAGYSSTTITHRRHHSTPPRKQCSPLR